MDETAAMVDETVLMLTCLVKSIPGATFDCVHEHWYLRIPEVKFRIGDLQYGMVILFGRLAIRTYRGDLEIHRHYGFELGDPGLVGRLMAVFGG